MSVDDADQPLREYFRALSDSLGINVQFDLIALKDAAIDPSSIPVGVALKNARLRTILNLILSQHSLGYDISDGILMISTTDKLNTMFVIKIYDCRDILSADRPENRPWDVVKSAAKSDDHGVKSENADPTNYKATTSNGPTIKHYFSGTSPERLINVIKTVVAAPTWDYVGGQGSIEEYGGLLVISQTRDVHEQVSDLLLQIAGKLAATAKK